MQNKYQLFRQLIVLKDRGTTEFEYSSKTSNNGSGSAALSLLPPTNIDELFMLLF